METKVFVRAVHLAFAAETYVERERIKVFFLVYSSCIEHKHTND